MTRVLRSDSYADALEYLYSFYTKARNVESRAEVSRRLLPLMGLESIRHFPHIIQITGTNGKGSVCRLLTQIMTGRFPRVITLTSPHVNSVRERIAVDGNPITKAAFSSALRKLSPFLEAVRDTHLHPTPMQVITLIAFSVHQEFGGDSLGIYEVGLGGQNDGTNVFARAVVGMTEISEDHIEECGGSFKSLVWEKVGLCNPGAELVHQPQHPEAEAIIRWYSAENRIDRTEVKSLANSVQGSPMPQWQKDNLALAVELARKILGRHFTPASDILQTHMLPCRLEHRSVGGIRFLLDGAHNPDAIRKLILFCSQTECGGLGRGVDAIVGISRSKPWQQILQAVVETRMFSNILVTQATRPRGVSPEVLGAYVTKLGARTSAFASLRSALSSVLRQKRGGAVIFGSLLLSADFDRALHALGLEQHAITNDEIDPPQQWMNPLI